MIYDKKLVLYSLQNTAAKGLMPKEQLVKTGEEYYGSRVIGYNRQYAALGADQRIDELVRIWRNNQVRANHYAVLRTASSIALILFSTCWMTTVWRSRT